MTMRMIILMAVGATAVAPTTGSAQVRRSSASTATLARQGRFGGVEATMIKNRARTLGESASGAGTRYISLTDRDVRGLSTNELLQRLSPVSVVAADGVRRIEILVDLAQPLTVRPPGGQPVYLGAATVASAEHHDVEVRAIVGAARVTIRPK